MKKIIIFGFPHTGTTILRCVLSHIDEIYEIVNETRKIKDVILSKNKKYILCKIPKMINIKEYNDYIKIFIIRNPVFVFSSMNKRFDTDKIPRSHSIEAYKKTISKFIEYSKLNIPNLYLIKYEDMFNNKYELLKNIFNDIGFKYTDDIFDNTKYKNEVQFKNKKINNPIVKPDDK